MGWGFGVDGGISNSFPDMLSSSKILIPLSQRKGLCLGYLMGFEYEMWYVAEMGQILHVSTLQSEAMLDE